MQHDFDALFDGLDAQAIRQMLVDILQGNVTVQGTLEGLQERLSDRVWNGSKQQKD